MTDWQALGEYFVATGFITGAIVYLGKQVIQAFFNSAQERYKAELARDLESHKHELALLSSEHLVRFSALHAQRAEVVRTLYAHLNSLFTGLEMLAHLVGEKDLDTHLDGISSSLGSIREFYPPNRIFIPKAIAEKIDAFQSATNYALGFVMGTNSAIAIRNEQGTPFPEAQLRSLKNAALEKRNEIKVLMDAVEDEFRLLLGNVDGPSPTRAKRA